LWVSRRGLSQPLAVVLRVNLCRSVVVGRSQDTPGTNYFWSRGFSGNSCIGLDGYNNHHDILVSVQPSSLLIDSQVLGSHGCGMANQSKPRGKGLMMVPAKLEFHLQMNLPMYDPHSFHVISSFYLEAMHGKQKGSGSFYQ